MSGKRRFPASPSSVRQARAYVAELMEGLPPALVEQVELMVSELATNSLEHARTDFVLDIEIAAGNVHVSISDTGSGEPAVRQPGPTEASGRGLRIVELLSAAWGVIPATPEDGKTVWFDAVLPDRDPATGVAAL